jgi:hypothetical protein
MEKFGGIPCLATLDYVKVIHNNEIRIIIIILYGKSLDGTYIGNVDRKERKHAIYYVYTMYMYNDRLYHHWPQVESTLVLSPSPRIVRKTGIIASRLL